jgi:hypothetical protein
MARGADVNVVSTSGGFTPLLIAAQNGNLEAVKLLLANGANVNAVSAAPMLVKYGVHNLGRLTPLTLAAGGPAKVVDALLAAGAQIKATEARGLTPLMIASATDHADLETVRTLMTHGADVRVKSVVGETALDRANKSGPTRVVAMLKRAKAPSGASAMVPGVVPPPAPVAHRAAVERSVSLLERAAGTFFTNGACAACHAQIVTDVATTMARRRGVRISDDAAAQRTTAAATTVTVTASRLLECQDPPGGVDLPGYTLAGLAAGDYPPDRATDALVFNIAAQQMSDGHWHQGFIARPPIQTATSCAPRSRSER